MRSPLKIHLSVCCIEQTWGQSVSICHNCTKHIQYFGKCSEAPLTNPFTNIFSMRTCSRRPLWFQSLTGCLSMWLQYFCTTVPDTPFCPKSYKYNETHYKKKIILIMKDKRVRGGEGQSEETKTLKTKTCRKYKLNGLRGWQKDT